MKSTITCLLLLLSFTLFSQNKFLKGYYIDNNETRIDCLIKNIDWKYNPTSFEIKANIDSEAKTISITECKEFSIENESKYIKATTEIDTSSEIYSQITSVKEPVFITTTIFLRVLVEGENNLYFYESENYPDRYFYKNKDSQIKQLVYKKYFNPNKNEGTDVFVNEFYKRQLTNDVKCNDNSKKVALENVEYKKDDLIEYFIKINNCNNTDSSTQSKALFKDKKSILSIKGVVAINSDGVKFQRNPSVNSGFDNNTNFSIGADIEILMPFNNYSWGVFIEPNFSKYKASNTFNYGLGGALVGDVTLDMNVLQVPFGVKYYFKSSSPSSFYLDGGMCITNLKDDTRIDFSNSSNDYYLSNFTYTFFGSLGYKYKKFAAEIRYNSTNNVSATEAYDIQFNRTSFILKYELFRK